MVKRVLRSSVAPAFLLELWQVIVYLQSRNDHVPSTAEIHIEKLQSNGEIYYSEQYHPEKHLQVIGITVWLPQDGIVRGDSDITRISEAIVAANDPPFYRFGQDLTPKVTNFMADVYNNLNEERVTITCIK
jgi:hypothetical protein